MRAPDAVVGVSIGIIVILFCVQSCGTGRVGPSFSPIVVLWCAPPFIYCLQGLL